MIRNKVQVHLWRPVAEGGRVFAVLHRCEAKGDYWQPITGNVEQGETPEACALREAQEEAGVQADRDDLSPRLWVHDWERGGHVFAEHVFALRCAQPDLELSGEHRAYEWLPFEEALGRLHFEGNRRGLEMAERWIEERERG